MRHCNRRRRRWLTVVAGIALLHLPLVSTAAAFMPGGFWRWQGIGFGAGYHAHCCCPTCGRPVDPWASPPYDAPRSAPAQWSAVGSW